MSSKNTIRALLLGSALLTAPCLQAVTYYWDNNGTTATFGAASGTWSSAGTVGSSTQGWTTATTGLVAPTGTITTLIGDDINFGTTLALTTGTVTVSGTVNANSITFGSASGQITLNGGTINLGDASTITVNNSVDFIRSVISGASTSLTKAGTGTLFLFGANSYTGATNITGGTLVVRNDSALGNDVSVATNTGLIYNAASDTQLAIGGNLSILGGASTVIGTSIGSTATSAAINVTGDATTDVANVNVNIYALSGVSHANGTMTLLTAAGGGSSLNNATYTLGNVYNNTDFTVGALSATATDLTVATTAATALTTAYWKGGLSGATNVWAVSNGSTQSNWVAESGGVNQALVPGATTDVYFSNSTVTTAPTATVLGSDMSIKSLSFFYNAGAFALNSDGYSLTIGSGGMTKNAGTAAATFGTSLILSADQTWTNDSATSITFSGLRTLNNAGFDLTFSGNATNNLATSGGNTLAITGAGGIIKNGTGSLVLDSNPTIAHSFTGGITVNGGRVGFQTAANVTTVGNITLNGGYLGGRTNSSPIWAGGLGTGATAIQILGGESGFSGEGASSSAFRIGTALSVLKWGASTENSATGFFNPSVLLLNGDQGMNVNGKGSLNNGIDLNGTTRTITSLHTTDGVATSGFTVSGAIVNTAGSSAGLTKTGLGNLILAAAATYNGDTTISSAAFNATSVGINGGGITLSGSGTIANTTGLILNGTGTLRLVNTAQVNRFADVSVTSNGGIISYENTNTAAITYTESFGALSLAKGVLNLVQTTNQSTSNGQTLTFGTSGTGNLTQAGAATVTFSALVTGPQASGNKNMFKVFGAGTTANTGSATGREILGPWATTGTTAILQTDYAIYSSDYVIPVGITNSAESNWTNSAYAYTTSVGGTIALTGTRTMNALRNTGATTVLTLATGVDLQTNGILNGVATTLTVNPGTGGVVTTPGGGNLYINAGSGAITINAPVANGGGTTNLVKSGAGLVILSSATNSFGGTTSINAGTLQVGNGAGTSSRLNTGGTYAGNIFIAGGASLRFWGDSSNTLTGIISGDGNLQMDRGTTTLGNANTYTGKTSLTMAATNATGVTINISSFNSVVGGSASSSLGAPTTVANGTIDFGGGVQAAAQINNTGTSETTDRVLNFTFNASGSRIIDTSATGGTGLLKFTSAFTSNGTTTGSIILQGTTEGEIVRGLAFGFTNLTKNGAGTWTLGGAVGNTGITTISANGGTLALQKTTSLLGGSAANWTAAKIIVNTGGTLALNVGAADEFSNANLTTILTNLGGLGGAINNNGLRSGSTIGFDTTNAVGGTFTIANNLANSTGTGGGAIGLIKRGTGILALTGTNTYTGTTTVNAGTLQAARVLSLYNNTTASWTAANINVKSGGTLAFNVGGAGEFTTGNMTTLFTNLAASSGATNGMNAGSNFGFDTTNASGGTFTISDAIADSTGGSGGARGLTKLGAGILELSNTNTYTGATTISNGVLEATTLANGGSNSGIGASSNAASNLVFSSASATLRYTGSSNITIDRGFTMSSGVGGGATIESSGTGTLSFDNTVAINYGTNNQTRTLTLGGTNTGANTFGKVIADNGTGATSLTKTGAGKWVLNQNNTYTGATTVNGGTLVINGDQTAATGATTVSGTGTKLMGNGTIGGDLFIESEAIHAVGNSPGLQTIKGNVTYKTGSIFEWDLAANKDTATGGARGTDYDAVDLATNKDLTVQSGAIFKVIENAGVDFTDTFWDTSRTWTDIFSVTGTVTGWATNTEVDIYDTSGVLQDYSVEGSFTITGTTLSWNVIPEPSTALAGLLLAAGLLRRRRPAASV